MNQPKTLPTKPSQSNVGALRAGMRVGRLTLVRPDGRTKQREVTWLCDCDCGGHNSVRSTTLRKGITKSCGCLLREAQRGGRKHHLPDGEAVLRRLFDGYKCTAKRRRITWEIAVEDFRHLITQDCSYCGSPPTQTQKNRCATGEVRYTGLDRVDNTQGYKKGNVVPCCKYCNSAKGQKSVKEFRAWAYRLANRQFSLAELLEAAKEAESTIFCHECCDRWCTRDRQRLNRLRQALVGAGEASYNYPEV